MHTFSARTAGARSSFLATWLVRVVTYSLPTLVWQDQGPGYALELALLLGALDGWFRLRVARTARSLAAEPDALVISSGLDSARIAWSNVLAIEVWHRLNRVDYAAVHYRTASGNSVATCWEQGHREELLLFVGECAALAQGAVPRRAITRAYLGDRAVYLGLLQHLCLDVAMALLVGVVLGVVRQAILVGAVSGVLSALLAATPYVHPAELVRTDGMWWQRRRSGQLSPVRILPNSLRAWARSLNESG